MNTSSAENNFYKIDYYFHGLKNLRPVTAGDEKNASEIGVLNLPHLLSDLTDPGACFLFHLRENLALLSNHVSSDKMEITVTEWDAYCSALYFELVHFDVSLDSDLVALLEIIRFELQRNSQK